MGQVPFGIVGDGRVARHMVHYLDLLKIPYRQWSRRGSAIPVETALADCRTLLILIRDSAIEPFLQSHQAFLTEERGRVHFSGSLSISLAHGAHPLMTFGPDLYDLETYEAIPFIHDQGWDFKRALPELPNRGFPIAASKKALYHSLCVLSGNFSVLLWQKLFGELERQIGLPREAAIPYLKQVMNNLAVNPDTALTGPLQRNDLPTVLRNIDALAGDPFEEVYRSFVNAVRPEIGVQL